MKKSIISKREFLLINYIKEAMNRRSFLKGGASSILGLGLGLGHLSDLEAANHVVKKYHLIEYIRKKLLHDIKDKVILDVEINSQGDIYYFKITDFLDEVHNKNINILKLSKKNYDMIDKIFLDNNEEVQNDTTSGINNIFEELSSEDTLIKTDNRMSLLNNLLKKAEKRNIKQLQDLSKKTIDKFSAMALATTARRLVEEDNVDLPKSSSARIIYVNAMFVKSYREKIIKYLIKNGIR